jgi:hypothetical protein
VLEEYCKTIVVICQQKNIGMFRTEINPQISDQSINLKTPIIAMGSCFSNNIGSRLTQNKFDILTNPFGVIFNPISITKLLKVAISKSNVDDQNWVESHGINLHYDVHSQHGSINKKESQRSIMNAISSTHEQVKKSKWLIITWGTAIVYERKDTGEIVANCHKVPADQFTKRLLTNKEIIANFESLITTLPADLNVLLTVSPVRHLKETLELNSVSKSTLRLACHQLSEQHSRVNYFPSYELVLDDLRDYRFYKSDMLHPSDEAIEYVWQKFKETYFDTDTLLFLERWQKIINAINHKAFNPVSDAHQQFISSTLESLLELKEVVDVSKEAKHLESQLIK